MLLSGSRVVHGPDLLSTTVQAVPPTLPFITMVTTISLAVQPTLSLELLPLPPLLVSSIPQHPVHHPELYYHNPS